MLALRKHNTSITPKMCADNNNNNTDNTIDAHHGAADSRDSEKRVGLVEGGGDVDGDAARLGDTKTAQWKAVEEGWAEVSADLRARGADPGLVEKWDRMLFDL